MIQKISVNPPEKIKAYTAITLSGEGHPLNGFPILSIDRDSYIVEAEIQSGINFHLEGGRHCLAIGKGCSLADGITFLIDLNHDHQAISQGACAFLENVSIPERALRKGSIIIQNDVWVGHGAMLMAGITLHNGCVVAANAVVTKDVPPYAIVGGNPAKVLRYRFPPEIISAFQKIAWWDWEQDVQWNRRSDFALPAEEFVEKYLPEAENARTIFSREPGPDVVLFPPDVGELFPLYPKVLDEYFAKARSNTELLIYIPEDRSTTENIRAIERILEKYEALDSSVTLQVGEKIDEHILFQGSDYYVTTRSRETVYRTCLAKRYGVKVLYGTDDGLFSDEFK